MRQVGSYLGYTGRAANVIAKAALDPFRNSRKLLNGRLNAPHLAIRLPNADRPSFATPEI
jgi:hypothetical protein